MLLVALATLSFATDFARTQEHTVPLRSPATVRGFLDDESHDRYVTGHLALAFC